MAYIETKYCPFCREHTTHYNNRCAPCMDKANAELMKRQREHHEQKRKEFIEMPLEERWGLVFDELEKLKRR